MKLTGLNYISPIDIDDDNIADIEINIPKNYRVQSGHVMEYGDLRKLKNLTSIKITGNKKYTSYMYVLINEYSPIAIEARKNNRLQIRANNINGETKLLTYIYL